MCKVRGTALKGEFNTIYLFSIFISKTFAFLLLLYRLFEPGALAKKECFGLVLNVNFKRTGPYTTFLVISLTA